VCSQELVPADSKCLSNEAFIDYSFVTGESEPVKIRKGEIIYAGGKQTEAAIECEVLKDVSHSYLTSLWNNESFKKDKMDNQTLVQKLARHFTLLLLLISFSAFFYWLPTDSARGWNALTTVLIVACPCALLLSSTFTNGAIMKEYALAGVYLKNASVIESLAKTTHIVFDKTGTITNQVQSISFHGSELGEHELALIYSVCKQSNHPLSKALAKKLSFCDDLEITEYEEITGSGLSAICNTRQIKVGSAHFVGAQWQQAEANGPTVYISIDNKVLGYFSLSKEYRKSLAEVFSNLGEKYKLSILSGDNDSQMHGLQNVVGSKVPMLFNQSPHSKTEYIQNLKGNGEIVMMIGDGLNDSGALMQSHTGMSISDDVNNFSPACDTIITGTIFDKLPSLIKLSVNAQNIIKASFVLSLCYNVIGLWYAVGGNLSPVVAAILMPLSSISIILFTTGSSALVARKLGLRQK
jgi:Cu+-exporting ATPase